MKNVLARLTCGVLGFHLWDVDEEDPGYVMTRCRSCGATKVVEFSDETERLRAQIAEYEAQQRWNPVTNHTYVFKETETGQITGISASRYRDAVQCLLDRKPVGFQYEFVGALNDLLDGDELEGRVNWTWSVENGSVEVRLDE